MTDLAKAVFAYEDMVDEQGIDTTGYPCSDINIPVELLAPERRTEQFLTDTYKRCVELKKPWQEVIQLDYAVPDDAII